MVIVVGEYLLVMKQIGLELDLPQCVSSDLQSVTVSHSENCVTRQGILIT